MRQASVVLQVSEVHAAIQVTLVLQVYKSRQSEDDVSPERLDVQVNSRLSIKHLGLFTIMLCFEYSSSDERI